MGLAFGREPVWLAALLLFQTHPLSPTKLLLRSCLFVNPGTGFTGALCVTGHVRRHTGQTTRLCAALRTSVSPSSSVCRNPASLMPAWPSCWRATQGEGAGKGVLLLQQQAQPGAELSPALCLACCD